MLINRFYQRSDSSSSAPLEFTHNDIIDPRYQYFNNKIIVHEDKEVQDILKDILSDFINGKRMTYNRLFLDELVNSLLKLYHKHNDLKHATIITEFSEINNVDTSKRIIYFKPFIMTDMDIVKAE